MTATGKARKREQAIAALLERPTIAEAAQAVGVSERTLRRWLSEADFAADYAAARPGAVRAGSDEELEAALKTVTEGTRLRLIAACTFVLGRIDDEERRATVKDEAEQARHCKEGGGRLMPSAHSPDAAAPTPAHGAP